MIVRPEPEIAQPGGLLILDVHHLLALAGRTIFFVQANRFFQVPPRCREMAAEKQRAAKEQVSHDERRPRRLLTGQPEAFFGRARASAEGCRE